MIKNKTNRRNKRNKTNRRNKRNKTNRRNTTNRRDKRNKTNRRNKRNKTNRRNKRNKTNRRNKEIYNGGKPGVTLYQVNVKKMKVRKEPNKRSSSVQYGQDYSNIKFRALNSLWKRVLKVGEFIPDEYYSKYIENIETELNTEINNKLLVKIVEQIITENYDYSKLIVHGEIIEGIIEKTKSIMESLTEDFKQIIQKSYIHELEDFMEEREKSVEDFASFANEMIAYKTRDDIKLKKISVDVVDNVVSKIIEEKINSFPKERGNVKLKSGQLVLFDEQNYSDNMRWDTQYSQKSFFKKGEKRKEGNIRVWIKVSCFQGQPWSEDGWVLLYGSDTDTKTPLFKRFLSGKFTLYRTQKQQDEKDEQDKQAEPEVSLVPRDVSVRKPHTGSISLLPGMIVS